MHSRCDAAARTQLDDLGIGGTVTIPIRRGIASFEPEGAGSHDQLQRRTLRVRDKVIVGYAMVVEGLTAEESVCLQENGIGGRRRFGCGIFVPVGRR
jgi:CRISPR-associated protein Cas6